MKPTQKPEPHLRPTRPSTLVIAAVVAGVLGWVLARQYYGDLPAIPWFPSAMLFLLGVAEFAVGRATKARIDRKPGTEPVQPLVVAWLAALAKASSLLGAIYVGLHIGLGVWLLGYDDVSAAERDLPFAGFGVVAGVVLVAGALWLEFSCRVPEPPSDDDQQQRGKTAPPGAPSR